jgi:hypothetical protein
MTLKKTGILLIVLFTFYNGLLAQQKLEKFTRWFGFAIRIIYYKDL